jgi:hypothetical protein
VDAYLQEVALLTHNIRRKSQALFEKFPSRSDGPPYAAAAVEELALAYDVLGDAARSMNS